MIFPTLLTDYATSEAAKAFLTPGVRDKLPKRADYSTSDQVREITEKATGDIKGFYLKGTGTTR